MSDKLTEALVWFKRTTGLDGDRSPFQGSKIEWVARAAERWASFPTDEDVERGAAAAHHEAATVTEPWASLKDYERERWRRAFRAGAEAVKREDR